jgi:chromosome segregation protein
VRLSSLKLSGFKSFVDPTNFQVPGQLVGVVGPNGCGKSNIIDAVRWVLGESKASELRGESMQDVIFNGSSLRKPAGRALVELAFDNSDGRITGPWGQYTEVVVKRTLTRDGTSQYYINNQVVRRRDIQDIFLGTGLGPRAYAIIGQGMIARIIEARPEELRVFLEEAAGISKYKERRRETENRLQDTRENLTRLEDILRELTTNLEKLQMQAEVAQKYKTLVTDQEESQTLLWLLKKNEADVEQKKIFQEIENAQIELEEHTAKLRQLELTLEEMRQTHYSVGDRLHNAQGALYQTNAAVGSLEAQIKFVLESRNRIQAQLTSLAAQRDQWKNQVEESKTELNELQFLLEEQIVKVEQAQEALQIATEALPKGEQDWREAQERLNESQVNIMQVQQRIELESAHQRNLADSILNLSVRRDRLLEEKNGLNVPDNARLSELEAELQVQQTQLEEANIRLAALEEKRPVAEQERRDWQERVNQEAAQSAQLQARLDALVQLQESVQAGAKVQPWLTKHELGELPRLWQKLNIEAGWAVALEAILRERVGALEVSNLDWVKAFFSDVPPAKLAVYSSAAHVHAAASVPAVEGLKSLFSLVKLNDPNVRSLLDAWLAGVYVATDVASAFNDRHKLPQGAYFVTKEGHVISRDSVQFYAMDTGEEGVLARAQEIENITKQVRAQSILSDEAKANLVRAESFLSDLTRQLQEANGQVNYLTQLAHRTQVEVLKLSELRDRYNQRSMQIEEDLKEITDSCEHQQKMQVEFELRFEALDIELAGLQERHEELQVAYQTKEQALALAREQQRNLERAQQEAMFLQQSQRVKMEELERTIATANEQMIQLHGTMQQGSLELENLNEQMNDEALQELLAKRMEQERALADVRHELDQVTQQLRHLEESRMEMDRVLQPRRDKITELQLKEQAARLNSEQYAEQLREAQADEAVLSEKLHSGLKISTLQAEVTRLTNLISNLGPVNMAALEELSQALTRKEFLDSQNQDLLEAITTLEDAIRKIDKETRELLQETFDKVNLHFAELFPILFGGGNAKLVMTGEEILDAGIQVWAQPPGKKNATIHLLSGGEKALTATALVFSLFQLNPAPFCLLDEVDAPLDDANTERFCNMVKKMSSKTQFLFISHNKIAMEMAQQLIGVTMQEQGVSRIVAVDIESVTKFNLEGRAA